MGESKRRKASMGDQYGKDERIYPWLPITKSQGEKFYKTTTKGAWIGIGFLAAIWFIVRFIGPAFGWWNVE